MSFEDYAEKKFPFLTLKIKIPEFLIKTKKKNVRITSSLCYFPKVTKSAKVTDYNGCFL
jgi:hypothetical protein